MAFTEADIENIKGIQSGQPPVAPAAPPAPAAASAPVTTPTAPTSAPSATTPPTPPTGAAPTTPAASEPPTPEEIEEYDLSDLGYESFNDLQERLSRADEMEQELETLSEYKAGPKFASDRQKLLYEFAKQVEGMELTRARQLLEVVDLNLNTLPDQQVRFEAFKLKPENHGLSHDEVASLFKDEELARFGNPQDTENPQTEPQKIRAKQATALAKQELLQLQNNWNATKAVEPTPEEVARENQRYRSFLAQHIAGFDGIQLKLQAKNEKGENLEGALNFKLDQREQLPYIVEALQDPARWWDSLLEEQGIMDAGRPVPDFVKFASLITRIAHHDELMNSAYQQGLADAKSNQLKAARNVADPASTGAVVKDETKLVGREAAAHAFMKTVGMI